MLAFSQPIQLAMLMASPTVAQNEVEIGGASPLLVRKGVPNAPDGYTPAQVSCPETRPVIRQATASSADETVWVDLRGNNTISALKDVLTRAKIGDIDTDEYLDSIVNDVGALPRIGIAIPGGGYRAMMNGAGAITAFDNRSRGSTDEGHLGGILQAAAYLSGISGGRWAVGSLYAQNFTKVESIISASSGFLSSLWQFDESILEGLSGFNLCFRGLGRH
ncbi:hypothetical protein ACHAPJ_013429 [Fusarium lateritium]